jgi:hypothetical protein
MKPHAWEKWILSEEIRTFLLRECKDRLKFSWEADQKHPGRYPIDTAWALSEIQETLSMKPRNKKLRRGIYQRPKPKTLAELVPERLIQITWEENHNSSFESAIRQAADTSYKEPKNSWKVFRGIVRAMETAYLVYYWGPEFSPRPKANILHRGLDKIAKAAGLGAQKTAGFAEFLDDLCPCGLRSHKGAITKLGSRFKRIRRPSS